MKELGWGFGLGWDWHPVTFFIALAVSLALAVFVLRKWQVAWVIPAFVLYFGLEWSLPWEWLFHLVFWVCVIVAVVTALLPRRSRLARVPFMMMSALLAVLLVILAGHAFAGWMNGDGQKKATETPASSSSASPTPSATPAVADCRTWMRQELDHSNWRVVGEGIAEIKSAETPEQAREAAMAWLDKVKVSPIGFTSAASYLLPDEQVDATTLFDDNGCATEAADTMLTKMSMAIGQATVKPDQAPADGYNSGVSDNVYVVSETPGIGGDRKAVRVELSNGQVFWVLARCGNPVTKHRPPHPAGPTDNPPPPTPKPKPMPKPQPGPKPGPGPTPGPKPTCENGGIPPEKCLTPKSSNPKDYPHPASKPPVSAQKPADPAPPKVPTSQPGGGGVTDSPTKAPGSESGATAPGVIPPRPVRSTPPPQGGNSSGNQTNDGSAGGAP